MDQTVLRQYRGSLPNSFSLCALSAVSISATSNDSPLLSEKTDLQNTLPVIPLPSQSLLSTCFVSTIFDIFYNSYAFDNISELASRKVRKNKR